MKITTQHEVSFGSINWNIKQFNHFLGPAHKVILYYKGKEKKHPYPTSNYVNQF